MVFQLFPQVIAADSTWTADCVSNGTATITGIVCLIQNIIRPVPALIALVAVGMIIFAGVRLLTAGADPKAVSSAWSTFTWAVIGLILLSVAWFILVLIEQFTGAKITDFGIFI